MALEKNKLSIPFQGLTKRADDFKNEIGEFEVLDNITRNNFGELAKRKGVERIADTTDKATTIISTDGRIVSVIEDRRHQAFSAEKQALVNTGTTMGGDTTTAFFGPTTDEAYGYAAHTSLDVNLIGFLKPVNTAAPFNEFQVTVQAIDENGFVFEETGVGGPGGLSVFGIDSGEIFQEPFIFSIQADRSFRVFRYNQTTKTIDTYSIALSPTGDEAAFNRMGMAIAINEADNLMVIAFANVYYSLDISDPAAITEIDAVVRGDAGVATNTVYDGEYNARENIYLFAIGKDGTNGGALNGFGSADVDGTGNFLITVEQYPVTQFDTGINGTIVFNADESAAFLYFSRIQIFSTFPQERISKLSLSTSTFFVEVHDRFLFNYQLTAKGFLNDEVIYLPVIPAAFIAIDTDLYPDQVFGKRGWGSICMDNMKASRGATSDVSTTASPTLSSGGRFSFNIYKSWIGLPEHPAAKVMSRITDLGSDVCRTIIPEDDTFITRQTDVAEHRSRGRLLDFSLDLPQEALTWNGASIISGGKPTFFDGRDWLNAGFSQDPFIISSSPSAVAQVAGTYFYRAIFEFRDAAGNTWQSQPSAQARYTTAAKGLFFPNFEITIASLDFMDRSQRTVVRLFRASQSAGTFHLVAERVQDATPATIDETILLQDRVTETVLLSS